MRSAYLEDGWRLVDDVMPKLPSAQLTLGQAYIQQVTRITALSNEADVEFKNSSDAKYCIDYSGRRWVRKFLTCNCLLAEALSYLLAKRLRVPVPDGAVNYSKDIGPSWLSDCITRVVHWSQESYFFIKNIADIGRMLALDVIVLNEDRHSANILLQATHDETQFIAWSIDMANAIIGEPRDYAERVDQLPSLVNLAPGLPIDLLQEEALRMATDAMSISQRELSAFVMEASL